MAKTIQINRKDFTDYFTQAGYTVGYVSVQGSNAGLMLDGSYTEDEIALKAVITLRCIPLTEQQLKEVLDEVYFWPYCDVYYYDPLTHGYRRISARRTVTEQKYRGFTADRKERWTGTVITFTEQ